MACEEVVHCATFAQFAALVETDVLVLAVGAESRQPAVKILQGWGFGFEGLAVEHAAEMVGDDDIARFAVISQVRFVSGRVGRRLDHETKVNGYPLVALGRTTRIVETTCRFSHLGGHAGRALIGGACQRELRDANGVLVHVGDAAMMEVA